MSEHHSHHHEHVHRGGILGWLHSMYGHSHAVYEQTDTALEASKKGIRTVKLSLLGLGLTAVFQLVIVAVSGSVALLADTIHNFADASTSVILWIAFVLGRRQATRTMTYGYGRSEDLAGILIVLIILASAVVAGYESVRRLIFPEPMAQPLWVAVAALIGFVGNESVAVYRIRTGREIGSAALVADGMHSRVDGFTSLAVLVSAVAAMLGIYIVDAIIGIGITVAILFIVRDAGRSVLLHILDGVEPHVIDAAEHAVGHVARVSRVVDLKARWIGHRVRIEVDVEVPDDLSLSEAAAVSHEVEKSLAAHVPAMGDARVRVVASSTSVSP